MKLSNICWLLFSFLVSAACDAHFYDTYEGESIPFVGTVTDADNGMPLEQVRVMVNNHNVYLSDSCGNLKFPKGNKNVFLDINKKGYLSYTYYGPTPQNSLKLQRLDSLEKVVAISSVDDVHIVTSDVSIHIPKNALADRRGWIYEGKAYLHLVQSDSTDLHTNIPPLGSAYYLLGGECKCLRVFSLKFTSEEDEELILRRGEIEVSFKTEPIQSPYTALLYFDNQKGEWKIKGYYDCDQQGNLNVSLTSTGLWCIGLFNNKPKVHTFQLFDQSFTPVPYTDIFIQSEEGRAICRGDKNGNVIFYFPFKKDEVMNPLCGWYGYQIYKKNYEYPFEDIPVISFDRCPTLLPLFRLGIGCAMGGIDVQRLKSKYMGFVVEEKLNDFDIWSDREVTSHKIPYLYLVYSNSVGKEKSLKLYPEADNFKDIKVDVSKDIKLKSVDADGNPLQICLVQDAYGRNAMTDVLDCVITPKSLASGQLSVFFATRFCEYNSTITLPAFPPNIFIAPKPLVLNSSVWLKLTYLLLFVLFVSSFVFVPRILKWWSVYKVRRYQYLQPQAQLIHKVLNLSKMKEKDQAHKKDLILKYIGLFLRTNSRETCDLFYHMVLTSVIDSDLSSTFEQLRETLDFSQRRDLVRLLFRLTVDDEGITNKEWTFVYTVMKEMNLNDYTIDYFIGCYEPLRSGSNGQSEDNSFKRKKKRSHSSHLDANSSSSRLEADCALLGVRKDASKEEIVKAYHCLAKIWHSDLPKNHGRQDECTKKMAEINLAYGRLMKS